MNVIGEIKDKNLLLFDDMIRTASTVIGDTKVLKKAGAQRIVSCVTHLNLTEGTVERILGSDVELVIATDSLPFQPPVGPQAKRFSIVSIAELLAKAVRRIHDNQSVTELYLQ
jgi:ribose-phosphate pyrophosphokinase